MPSSWLSRNAIVVGSDTVREVLTGDEVFTGDDAPFRVGVEGGRLGVNGCEGEYDDGWNGPLDEAAS
jgi:hypothetical protein